MNKIWAGPRVSCAPGLRASVSITTVLSSNRIFRTDVSVNIFNPLLLGHGSGKRGTFFKTKIDILPRSDEFF